MKKIIVLLGSIVNSCILIKPLKLFQPNDIDSPEYGFYGYKYSSTGASIEEQAINLLPQFNYDQLKNSSMYRTIFG